MSRNGARTAEIGSTPQAQLRELPNMDSAKVSILARGARVRLLQRLEVDDKRRVLVRDASTNVEGWLSAKALRPPEDPDSVKAAPGRAPFVTTRPTFTEGKTTDGVSFLRTRLGRPGPASPVVLALSARAALDFDDGRVRGRGPRRGLVRGGAAGSPPPPRRRRDAPRRHGTSFNAGAWVPTLEKLAGRIDADCWLVEWTGHGSSRACPGAGHGPERFDIASVGGRDVFSVLAHGDCACYAETRPVFGVGHSVGAQILCHAELERPGTFSGLVCVDPILSPPRADAAAAVAGLVRGTLGKKNVFETRNHEDVAAYFSAERKSCVRRSWRC